MKGLGGRGERTTGWDCAAWRFGRGCRRGPFFATTVEDALLAEPVSEALRAVALGRERNVTSSTGFQDRRNVLTQAFSPAWSRILKTGGFAMKSSINSRVLAARAESLSGRTMNFAPSKKAVSLWRSIRTRVSTVNKVKRREENLLLKVPVALRLR